MLRYIAFFSIVALLAACGSDTELHQVFDDNGQLIEEYMRHKENFRKQGLSKKYYPGTKDLMEVAHYKDDAMDGEYIRFAPNGDTASVSMMKGGQYQGTHREYYPGNRLMQRYEHVDGKITGDFVGYYPDGTLKEKLLFEDNAENGPFVEYHPNGKKKTEGKYINGKEQGELLEYDTNGELIRKAFCKMEEMGGKEVKVCETTWEKE